MKRFFFIAFSLLFNTIFAQAPQPTISGEEYYNCILTKYQKIISGDAERRHFAEAMVYDRAVIFNYCDIISNWQKADDYINELFKRIIPENDTNHLPVKIYLSKSPEVNAFAFEDGTIVINIGLLANVNSEAELAGVISHELGHFALNHSLKGYQRQQSANNRLELAGYLGLIGGLIMRDVTVLNYFKKSRNDEAEADDFSLALLSQSPYSNRGLIGSMKLLYLVSRQEELKKENIGYHAPLLSTHPSSEDRCKKAEEYVNQHPDKSNKPLNYNDSIFTWIRSRARERVIEEAINQYQYSTAIENGFKAYLEDPGNRAFAEGLAEALRRKMLLDPSESDKVFICDGYSLKPNSTVNSPFLNYKNNFKTDKKMVSGSIHYHLFDGPLVMDSASIKNINALEILDLDTIEFVNNMQAYEYFVKKAHQLNSVKIYFTEGLFAKDRNTQKLLLEKYLSLNPQAQYSDYCKAIINKELYSFEANDTLILYNDYTLLKSNALLTKKIVLQEQAAFIKRSKKIEDGVLAMNRTGLLYTQLPFMSEEQRQNYMDLNGLASSIQYANKTSGRYAMGEIYKSYEYTSVDIFLLKPELWYFMKKENVNMINLYNYSLNGMYLHEITSIGIKAMNSEAIFGRFIKARKEGKSLIPQGDGYYGVSEDVKTNLKDYFEELGKIPSTY
jgi:hypothetical protein